MISSLRRYSQHVKSVHDMSYDRNIQRVINMLRQGFGPRGVQCNQSLMNPNWLVLNSESTHFATLLINRVDCIDAPEVYIEPKNLAYPITMIDYLLLYPGSRACLYPNDVLLLPRPSYETESGYLKPAFRLDKSQTVSHFEIFKDLNK